MKILFVCTGNSCRSQMAEGFANALGRDLLQAKSAGVLTRGVNPRAIAVMNEVGIDISKQKAKMLTQNMIDWADQVITLCGHADQHCPVLPDSKIKRYHQFEDPAQKTGSEEEIMGEFRKVRDEIKDFVTELSNESKKIVSDITK